MTAKEYLEDYKRIVKRRKMLIKQIEDIDSDIISIGGINYGDKVKNSPKNDPIGEIVIQLVNKKARIGLNIVALQAKEVVYANQIAQMQENNEAYYEVLVYRYMFGLEWKEICDAMKKSRSRINVLHGEALKEFDLLFKISKVDKKVQKSTK